MGEGWYRRKIGRRIEMAVNRLWGWFFLILALVVLWLTLGADDFQLAIHWPGLLVAGLSLLGARYCFKARHSVIEEFGDEGSGSRRG